MFVKQREVLVMELSKLWKRRLTLIIIGLAGALVAAVGVNLGGPTSNVYMNGFSSALQSIGIGVIIAVTVPFIEHYIQLATSRGPTSMIFTHEERCAALTACVESDYNKNIYTTRYSNRGISDTPKSDAFVNALNYRIDKAQSDTRRIISLDNPKKVEHAKALVKHSINPMFGLAVLNPHNPLCKTRLDDLLVIDQTLVCIGIETRNEEENYWIKIEDEAIANKFRDYYEQDHWRRPGVVEIKQVGKIYSEADMANMLSKIDEVASEKFT